MKCPACGYSDEPKFNPSKKIVKLRKNRSRQTRAFLRRAMNVIATNIPSENNIIKQYYFHQSISKIKDEQVDYGITRFIESKQYLKGKGFKYLEAIIKTHDKNKEVILKNELEMRGKPPSVVKIKEST